MKAKTGIFIALIVAGAGFLVVSSMGEKENLKLEYPLHQFLNVLDETPEKIEGRYITLFGKVKEGTIRKSGVEAEFVLEENNTELDVFFNGKTLLPDTFKDGVSVSVEGRYDFENKRFESEKIMAKCESKYGSNAVDFPVEAK